jgi:intein-encoded DNA endonuclease-like protein
LSHAFGVPTGTLYDWHRNKRLPHGRKGKIIRCPELLYVIGALLGDGCLYQWRITNHHVILVGDKLFTEKYAAFAYICTNKKVKAYIDRSKNVFFVRINNYELYLLFQRSRKDLGVLRDLIHEFGEGAAIHFVEGFFDAEGCVKIIREPQRKTPKICLDCTNTYVKAWLL